MIGFQATSAWSMYQVLARKVAGRNDLGEGWPDPKNDEMMK
jgi:hypothetical protein